MRAVKHKTKARLEENFNFPLKECNIVVKLLSSNGLEGLCQSIRSYGLWYAMDRAQTKSCTPVGHDVALIFRSSHLKRGSCIRFDDLSWVSPTGTLVQDRIIIAHVNIWMCLKKGKWMPIVTQSKLKKILKYQIQ